MVNRGAVIFLAIPLIFATFVVHVNSQLYCDLGNTSSGENPQLPSLLDNESGCVNKYFLVIEADNEVKPQCLQLENSSLLNLTEILDNYDFGSISVVCSSEYEVVGIEWTIPGEITATDSKGAVSSLHCSHAAGRAIAWLEIPFQHDGHGVFIDTGLRGVHTCMMQNDTSQILVHFGVYIVDPPEGND